MENNTHLIFVFGDIICKNAHFILFFSLATFLGVFLYMHTSSFFKKKIFIMHLYDFKIFFVDK